MGINNTSKENNNNYLFDEEDISEYYGFKSKFSKDENASLNFAKEKNSQIKEDSIITSSEKFDRIPTTFEWDDGGINVYVTGSFCNWKQFFLMKKNSQNSFILTLNLPKGYHQYKFKVDNVWKYNEKFPICNDSGYINNFVDTSNWEITVINKDEGSTMNSSNDTDNNGLSKLSKSRNSVPLKLDMYSDYIPKKDEFGEKIPELPGIYKNILNINLLSNQNNIGNKQFLKISENNILSDNMAFKKIINIHNEQINHLKTNITNNKKNDKNNNKDIIYSISSRYRLKYTTFIYYNPQKNKNEQI